MCIFVPKIIGLRHNFTQLLFQCEGCPTGYLYVCRHRQLTR